MQKHQNAFARMPQEQQTAIEKARQEYDTLRSAPEKAQHNELAGLAMEVHQATPNRQVRTYEEGIAKIQQAYPGVQIPEDRLRYTPENADWLADKFYGQVHSVANKQNIEEKTAGDPGHMQRTQAEIGGRKEVAEIQAGASKYGADQRSVAERPNRPDIQAKLDELTINSPTKLAEWMKRNGVEDEGFAKQILQSQIDTYKTDKMQEQARKGAVDRQSMQMLLPPGHPDKNKSYTTLVEEELQRLVGKPSQKSTTKGVKDTARPGEKVMIDKNGNKAVNRDGKWVEVH